MKTAWEANLLSQLSTVDDGWVIDLDKGIIADIKSMSGDQYDKYIRHDICTQRPDLNYRQAIDFSHDQYEGE
jgi:hypothetical protein